MGKLIYFFLISFLLISPFLRLFADDVEQYLPDQFEGPSDLENIKIEEPGVIFLPDNVVDKKYGDDIVEKSPSITGQNIDDLENTDYTQEMGKSVGYTVPGTFENLDNYIDNKNIDLVGAIAGRERNGLSFSYYRDSYKYHNGRKTFESIFEKSSGSHRYGFLEVAIKKYIAKSPRMGLAWGVNVAAGLNVGYGYFDIATTQSETLFRLWTIPLDFAFIANFSLSSWLGLAVAAGPSAMGLVQNRNDRSDDEKDKARNQIGWGYFANCKLQWGLSRIFTTSAFKLFSDYSVTKYSLDLLARYNNYSNFQDNIKISGMAFGLGLTFEYL